VNAIARLAEHVLLGRDPGEFRKLAAAEFKVLDLADPSSLAAFLHADIPEPTAYDPRVHGYGGWISACHFATFELIYNFGEEALPLLREVAWGEYDWTQGNAIELLLRLAAAGVETDPIIAEIEREFPRIRFEAQLYAIQPLLSSLEGDPGLQSIFDRLRRIPEFEQAWDELVGEE
jgi:hypothetical protein